MAFGVSCGAIQTGADWKEDLAYTGSGFMAQIFRPQCVMGVSTTVFGMNVPYLVFSITLKFTKAIISIHDMSHLISFASASISTGSLVSFDPSLHEDVFLGHADRAAPTVSPCEPYSDRG